MKRVFLVLLCVLFLCGCSSSDEPEIVNNYARGLQMGNFIFDVPEAFDFHLGEDEDVVLIVSENKDFEMSIVACDVSEKDEIGCKGYLIAFDESACDEMSTCTFVDSMQLPVASFSLDWRSGVREGQDKNTYFVLTCAFTDSYYVYRSIVTYPIESDSDYVTLLAQFLNSGDYLGEEPKYNFIQCKDFA